MPVIVGFKLAERINRARQAVVRENHMRADEDTIFDDAPMVEACVVLDLDPIADLYATINEYPFAEDAFVSNRCGFTNVCMMPNACATMNDRSRFNQCGGMDRGSLTTSCRRFHASVPPIRSLVSPDSLRNQDAYSSIAGRYDEGLGVHHYLPDAAVSHGSLA